MATEQPLDSSSIYARLAVELPHWTLHEAQLQRTFRTGGWKASLLAVNCIGHLAEAAWHHPDVRLSYDSVQVSLTTHSAGGITEKDFALAHLIEDSLLWRPPAGSALDGTPDDDRYRYLHHEAPPAQPRTD